MSHVRHIPQKPKEKNAKIYISNHFPIDLTMHFKISMHDIINKYTNIVNIVYFYGE